MRKKIKYLHHADGVMGGDAKEEGTEEWADRRTGGGSLTSAGRRRAVEAAAGRRRAERLNRKGERTSTYSIRPSPPLHCAGVRLDCSTYISTACMCACTWEKEKEQHSAALTV